ncbi:MAG: aminopeptidase P family protein [Elusimicrobia bacterium]|nr:aminopeptidase P family protein [Elusimicrobiota bacterium]
MNFRIKSLQKRIVSKKLDGFVSFNPSNIFYLAGFRAENSFVFISRKDIILVVSEVNYPSAKKHSGCKIQIANDSFFKKYKNKKIGFDNGISVARLEKLKKIRGVKFESCSNFIEDLRLIKDQSEIKKIKTACKISSAAIEFAEGKIKTGITEKELADELEYFLRRGGAEKSAFDIIVASGKNSADPHHKPTVRKIQKNDIVIIDLGCVYQGYNSDLTRTFFLGKISKLAKNIFKIVKEAQKKAINVIKHGISCKEVDFAARNFIRKNGFGKYFIHGTGHGVGIDIHEEPSVSAKTEVILKAGMIVTVEPGIYIPDKFGVRMEDTILVTKSGCEVLTK